MATNKPKPGGSKNTAKSGDSAVSVPFSRADLNGLGSALLDHRDTAPAPAAVIQESRVQLAEAIKTRLLDPLEKFLGAVIQDGAAKGAAAEIQATATLMTHLSGAVDALRTQPFNGDQAATLGVDINMAAALFFMATELRRIEPMKRQAERRAVFDVHRPQLGKTKLYEQYAHRFPGGNKAATHQLRLDAPKQDDGLSPFFWRGRELIDRETGEMIPEPLQREQLKAARKRMKKREDPGAQKD